jgi:hypothetical protein
MSFWLFAEAALERMDPENRAKVLMLITGLVILGCAMIVFVAMGARWARRQVRKRDARNRPPIEDKWYARPLVEPLTNEPPEREESEG